MEDPDNMKWNLRSRGYFFGFIWFVTQVSNVEELILFPPTFYDPPIYIFWTHLCQNRVGRTDRRLAGPLAVIYSIGRRFKL